MLSLDPNMRSNSTRGLFSAISGSVGVSHETVRKRLRAATHDHIRDIVVNLWQAQRDGQMLLLAIPAGFDAEQNLAIDYLRWVLGQLAELWGIRADVHYRPTPDGAIAFGLTDPAMPGGQP